MSLPPLNKTSDYDRFMNQYLANLNQTIQNQTLVYNAVSANLSGDFADVPQMPQDNRSVEDKLRDIDSLKTQLRPMLMSLTDGATANEIVKELDDRPQLLQVAIQAFPTLYQSLKPLWSMGVPAVVFIQAVANLAKKQDQTAGIDPVISEEGGLLNRIPYVVGLETDEINRQIQIEKDMEASEIAAQEREADRLQGEANLEQALLEFEELKRAAGVVGRARLVKKAKEVVKQRREELAQLQAQQEQEQEQEQEQQQEPTLGLQQPLSRSTSLETKSGEATPAGETSQAREARKARIAQAEANASARRDQERIEALKQQELAREEVLYDQRGRKGIQAFKANVSRAKVEREIAERENERERIKRREERQSLSQKPVEAEAVEAEPVEAEVVASMGRITRAIEEGSFEDLIQQLRQNASTRYLQLRALSETGGQLQLKINGVLTPVSIDVIKTANSGGRGNPANKKYWTNETNVKELYDLIQSRKTSGSGLKSKPRRRTMSGRGVSFNIKEDEEVKPSPKKTIKLNIQGVIEKEPSYVPFGRYAINKHRLAGDILMLRTPKNGVVLKLPTQKISNKVSKIILTVANKGVPSFEAIGELDNNDKEILHKILQECHITNISTPNPSRDKSDDMYRRFVILRGEICSGNNNPALAKELKRLIIVLMGKDLLPKREGTQALVELALLEM